MPLALDGWISLLSLCRLNGYSTVYEPVRVFTAKLSTEHIATILLLRRRMRLSREVSDEVVRSRGCELKGYNRMRGETTRVFIIDDAVTINTRHCDSYPLVRSTRQYRDNKRHGRWWHVWYDNEDIASAETVYVNDEEHGLSRKWWSNGKLASETPLVHGVRDGVVRKWYRSGTLGSETPYVKGLICGTVREWHENGLLCSETEYVDGVKSGNYLIWDAHGLLMQMCVQYRHFDCQFRPHTNFVRAADVREEVERELYRDIPLQQLRRLRPKIPWLCK